MRRMNHTIGSRVAGLMRLASILLLSALTAFAVVSCGGSDDTPDTSTPSQPKGNMPIAFSGDLSEGKSESHARTRADLSVTHQTFYAWAYKNPASGSTETVMQEYTVKWIDGSAGSTTTNSRGWEYVNQQASGTVQSIKYWDFSAADYRFFGYAGSGVDVTSTSTSVSFSFSVDATTANLESMTSSTPLFSKLWYKTGSAIANDIIPVQLEFLQPYVKVRFIFKQSAPADVNFYKKDIRFAPKDDTKKIATAGTFTVTYPLKGNSTTELWSVSSTTTLDYLSQADDVVGNPPVSDDGNWYVVLPAHAEDQGPYTLSLKVNNEQRSVIVPAQYMEWRPGYEYTYIFKITDVGGVALDGVVAGFRDWTTEEKNKEIYNW